MHVSASKLNFNTRRTFLGLLIVTSGLPSISAFAQDGRRWDVEVARYGQPGRFVDVTRRVQMARGRDGDLDFLVTNDNLGGDPAPNVPKRLDVLFRMGDRRFAVSVPENEHLFAPMLVRQVIAASYHARGMEPHAVCREACANVTDRVRARLHDGLLEVHVNNDELGGDPTPNVPKQLTVRFVVRRDEQEVTVDENSVLRIPENLDGDPMLIRELSEFRDHRP
jgi:hypothetical protein